MLKESKIENIQDTHDDNKIEMSVVSDMSDTISIESSNSEKNETKDTIVIKSNLSTYRYTPEQIEEFYASDNGQDEEHTLEYSICRPLIGKQTHKPFFYYCKLDPKVEFLHLQSLEDHIRLKDSQRHKAKLLEPLDKEDEKEIA
jgi:hypothetical protein